MYRFYCLTFFIAGFLVACASAPRTEPVQVAVAPTEPEPVIEQEFQSELQLPEPEISPELKKLHLAVESGNSEEIKAAAHTIIDAGPSGSESAEALRALAELSIRNERYSEAGLYADAAIQALPDNAENLFLKARIAHLQQHDDEAVKNLRKCIELAPTDARPYLLKASILLNYLDTERALADAEKAYKINPKDCESMVLYADALYASKQYSEAAEHYSSAMTQCRISEDSLKKLAKIYELHLQDAPRACEIYTKLTEMFPENPYYKASRDYQCGL